VLAVLPGLKTWSVAEDCCRESVAALAINGGVLLASRIGRADELRGYDLATGQQLWRQPYDRDTISMDHPRCAVRHESTFVIRGRGAPLIVNAGTGAVVAANAGDDCLAFDPIAPTAVDTGAVVIAYDLDTGKQLWSMPADQVRALDLEIASVYNNRVYATTRTARLVLDARTGKELARGWKVAPMEWHDGWVVGVDARTMRKATYPGNG
jgi:outer membrane protein assembly factor BamB